MLNMLAERSTNEKGFTLIELLVVILIIGILAAIALPAFLGQRVKGQDSAAKSDARNAVSAIESCYATKTDYTQCANTTVAKTDSGLDLISNAAAVGTGANAGYTVTATSKSNNTFTIAKAQTTGKVSRTCTVPATGSDKGGCDGTSW